MDIETPDVLLTKKPPQRFFELSDSDSDIVHLGKSFVLESLLDRDCHQFNIRRVLFLLFIFFFWLESFHKQRNTRLVRL